MIPSDSAPSITSASDTTSSPIDSNAALRRLLIVIHSRELLRACLSYWLGTLGQEFEVISAPDVKKLISSDTLSRACGVVIGANSSVWPDTWLQDQIAFLRTTRPMVPIVVICEEDIAEKYNGMKLQGFIPTSSTVEMAAAVINLVTMGGSYIAYAWDKPAHSKSLLPSRSASKPAPAALLTPREEAVLDLLERGMPNKLIAYNLRISQSTVKAHVHNIIAKLDVHNRTEAAVRGNHEQLPKPTMERAPRQSSYRKRQPNEVASSGADPARRIKGSDHIHQLPPHSRKSSR